VFHLTPQRHVIAGHESASHALALEAQDGGLLTDGMGAGGHNASFAGLDYALVRAGAGQEAQLEVLALWLSQGNNVRVKVDGVEETVLQGTVLPPADGGGRQFRSKVGGKIEVLLVEDRSGSLSFVSLAVRMGCVSSGACGAHGSCVGGNCTCVAGYSGMGAMVFPVERALLRFGAAVCG
jgi:hypothetical protein